MGQLPLPLRQPLGYGAKYSRGNGHVGEVCGDVFMNKTGIIISNKLISTLKMHFLIVRAVRIGIIKVNSGLVGSKIYSQAMVTLDAKGIGN